MYPQKGRICVCGRVTCSGPGGWTCGRRRSCPIAARENCGGWRGIVSHFLSVACAKLRHLPHCTLIAALKQGRICEIPCCLREKRGVALLASASRALLCARLAARRRATRALAARRATRSLWPRRAFGAATARRALCTRRRLLLQGRPFFLSVLGHPSSGFCEARLPLWGAALPPKRGARVRGSFRARVYSGRRCSPKRWCF